MRSISEFIMEQEQSDRFDQYSETQFIKQWSECMCVISLMECYTEQMNVMEFAEENGISSLNIIMEADNGGQDQKDGVVKKIKNGFTNMVKRIIEFFKSIYRRIMGVIVDKRAEKIVKMIKSIEGYERGIDFDREVLRGFEVFMNFCYWVTQDVKFLHTALAWIFEGGYNESEFAKDEGIFKDMNKRGDSFIKASKDFLKNKIKTTTIEPINISGIEDEAVDFFGKRGKIHSEMMILDKNIKLCEKAVRKGLNYTSGNEERNKIVQRYIQNIKEMFTKITQVYDLSMKCFNKSYADLKKALSDATAKPMEFDI